LGILAEDLYVKVAGLIGRYASLISRHGFLLW